MARERFRTLLARSLRLRCPLCGRGKLFRGWLRMRERCPHCGIKFEREPGFFLGSIYFNYGLTALIVAIAYPVLLVKQILPTPALMGTVLAFVVIFPVLFFPFARSLWLGFDQYWDPRAGEDRAPDADRAPRDKPGP